MCLCWVYNNLILLYRGEPRRMYIRIRKLYTCKNYSFHCIITVQQPTNETTILRRYTRD
nr:MAG TPA: hypothetical protein [Caudoviricetes sp.]